MLAEGRTVEDGRSQSSSEPRANSQLCELDTAEEPQDDMESIDLAESLDSTNGLGYLRDLYHQLKPHAKVPAVRDFLERAQGFVAV